MKAFQELWRKNSDIWVEKYQYKEAALHLIMQAFLQRLLNGGGQIVREYTSGKKCIDLCAIYHENKYPIELKIHDGPKTLQDGLRQLPQYIDQMGTHTGWLVIFDRNPDKAWEEKIYWDTLTVNNKTVHVVSC